MNFLASCFSKLSLGYEFMSFAKCISTANTSEHDSKKGYKAKPFTWVCKFCSSNAHWFEALELLGLVLFSKIKRFLLDANDSVPPQHIITAKSMGTQETIIIHYQEQRCVATLFSRAHDLQSQPMPDPLAPLS